MTINYEQEVKKVYPDAQIQEDSDFVYSGDGRCLGVQGIYWLTADNYNFKTPPMNTILFAWESAYEKLKQQGKI